MSHPKNNPILVIVKKELIVLFFSLLISYSNSFAQTTLPAKETRPITFVLIMDGLRPDAVTLENMPNLFKLQNEGVNFTNSHAAIPTVTRVNSSSLATGSYSKKHGILSNSIYLEKFNPKGSISTSNYKNLIKIDSISHGNLLTTKTIGEILNESKLKFVAISSGSTGSAYLLNNHASKGTGYLINSGFDNRNNSAIPYKIGNEIRAQFGKSPMKNENSSYNTSVDWTQNVLYEYVLPKIKPDVVFNWFTEPDHSQHRFGTGSKEYYDAIRNNDRNIGLLLEKLKELDLYNRVNIIVTSDHGMNEEVKSINLKESCKDAGIDSDDFVIASSGETLLLHVKDHDKNKIKKIVEHLQSKDWVGAIFTQRSSKVKQINEEFNPYGFVDGTFSLDLIHTNHPDRSPDILFHFKWTSDNNQHGISGTSFKNTNGKPKIINNKGGHGNMSPACINNTLIAWGKNFKSNIEIDNPAGIVDITPTILDILDINNNFNFDGRILHEALKNGPDHQKVIFSSKTFTVTTKDKKYKAAVQISKTGRFWYVDKGWRK